MNRRKNMFVIDKEKEAIKVMADDLQFIKECL